MESKHSGTPMPPGRMQLLSSLLYSMIPLIGFWLVDEFFGLEAGIVAAIVLGIGEVGWIYWQERRWEPFAVWSAVLVIVMGILSWQLESPKIILLKPAILELVMAALFIGSSLAKKPFMLLMAQKQYGALPMSDLQFQYFNGINWRVGLLFLAHTGVTVYAALCLSTAAWVWVKGLLFYAMFALFLLGEFIYARWVLRPKLIQHFAQQQAFLAYQRNLIAKMRNQLPEKDGRKC